VDRVTVSVLTPPGVAEPGDPTALDHEAFRDLHLDQIIAAVARRAPVDGVARHLERRPNDPSVGEYRQAVFQDLESPALTALVREFTERLQRAQRLVGQAHEGARGIRAASDAATADDAVEPDPDTVAAMHASRLWLVTAGQTYVKAVHGLADGLDGLGLSAPALLALRDHLGDYRRSAAFGRLETDTKELTERLAAVRYRLRLSGNHLEVAHDDGGTDFVAAVAATFERFAREQPGKPSSRPRPAGSHLLDGPILERVAELHPETFAALEHYAQAHATLFDPTLTRFGDEIQVYLAYLAYLAPLRAIGLPFCYPSLTAPSARLAAADLFDLALAAALADRGVTAVCNDVAIDGDERVLVVTGANQGGKTTFARAVGQLVHLASLGCPVPGRRAEVAVPDRILTHFARGEQLDDRRGRLLDDLERMRTVLDTATEHSVVIVNELFRSTTVADASALGRRVVGRLIATGVRAVFVTFLDELSRLGPATVSLVATVDPDHPATRTFRVERRPADGRAYAHALAFRHGLTYEQLTGRDDVEQAQL
jgi:DNA mismatch repair protein MutS